ncbi:MAG: DNA-deoxyinosine glycosylase [Oscillospiraceae bacterium]|nr:DNA-deoxyinosine glycosylase [Oscillospiraceae bacterium]
MSAERGHFSHGFGPVYDAASRILILGSFPSAASRAVQFYYGHPRNRFWPVLAALLDVPLPDTTEQRRNLLLSRHIALWDAIEECDVEGSSDGSIRNAVPTDLSRILSAAPVRAIFTNGGVSAAVYAKYQLPLTGIAAVRLPSTSPANAAWSFDRLCAAWARILEDL